MAKFNPYDWQTKQLKVRNTETGEVYGEFEIKVRKTTSREFRNGYSAWDGWITRDCYEAIFYAVDEDGEEREVKTTDYRKKDVIYESILRYANYYMPEDKRPEPRDMWKLDKKGK